MKRARFSGVARKIIRQMYDLMQRRGADVARLGLEDDYEPRKLNISEDRYSLILGGVRIIRAVIGQQLLRDDA